MSLVVAVEDWGIVRGDGDLGVAIENIEIEKNLIHGVCHITDGVEAPNGHHRLVVTILCTTMMGTIVKWGLIPAA